MSHASLINVASASNQESFQRIRDFLGKRAGTYDYSTSGIGWTLHDSSYAVSEDTLTAGDWVVFTSPGEDGRQALCVQFVYQATYIKMQGWLSWNNSTHAGVQQIGNSSNTIYTPSGACTLWVLGDLDAFYVANTNGATNYLAGCGCIKPGDGMYDNTIAIAPSAVSTGTSVVVAVDVVPAAWAAGQKLYHWDSAGVSIVEIEAVGASSVTLTSVSTGKLAGSRLAGDLGVFCSISTNFSAPSILANRTTGAASTGTSNTPSTTTMGYVTADNLGGRRVAERCGLWYSNSAAYGLLPHLYLTHNTGAVQGAAHVAPDGTPFRLLRHQTAATYLIREA